MEIPEGANIIIGQTHFIKTAEDLYKVMVNVVPDIKFGIAFCEASGPCLVRSEGNDSTLKGHNKGHLHYSIDIYKKNKLTKDYYYN